MGELKDRLAELKETGENQKDFSDRVGVAQSAMSNYLRGSIPNVEVLKKICENTGVDLNWLVTGEGPKYLATSRWVSLNDPRAWTPEMIAAFEAQEPVAIQIAGAKATRRLTDRDRAEIAASHLAELEHASRDEAGALAELVRDAATNAVTRQRVLEHYQFVRWQDKKKT